MQSLINQERLKLWLSEKLVRESLLLFSFENPAKAENSLKINDPKAVFAKNASSAREKYFLTYENYRPTFVSTLASHPAAA